MTSLEWIKWALFGNDEDTVDGKPDDWSPLPIGSFKRRLAWWLRNPFHNLTWHVIGFVGDVESSTQNQGSDEPGWLHVKTVRRSTGKTYRLIGHTGTYQWYVGWRSSGAFGLKFRKYSNG
jgi:hypothetical protein